MFQTNDCSSSGGLYKQLLYKKSCRKQVIYDKFASAQQENKYINIITSKKNCTKPMQQYDIIKHAGKNI